MSPTPCEFIILVGPPASGKTLNKTALMRLHNCDDCYDEPSELHAWAHVSPTAKRVLVLTHNFDLEDPRHPGWTPGNKPWKHRVPRLEGLRVTIEQARDALGNQWIEPISYPGTSSPPISQ